MVELAKSEAHALPIVRYVLISIQFKRTANREDLIPEEENA